MTTAGLAETTTFVVTGLAATAAFGANLAGGLTGAALLAVKGAGGSISSSRAWLNIFAAEITGAVFATGTFSVEVGAISTSGSSKILAMPLLTQCEQEST
jgi:hypothetical protein